MQDERLVDFGTVRVYLGMCTDFPLNRFHKVSRHRRCYRNRFQLPYGRKTSDLGRNDSSPAEGDCSSSRRMLSSSRVGGDQPVVDRSASVRFADLDVFTSLM